MMFVKMHRPARVAPATHTKAGLSGFGPLSFPAPPRPTSVPLFPTPPSGLATWTRLVSPTPVAQGLRVSVVVHRIARGETTATCLVTNPQARPGIAGFGLPALWLTWWQMQPTTATRYRGQPLRSALHKLRIALGRRSITGC